MRRIIILISQAESVTYSILYKLSVSAENQFSVPLLNSNGVNRNWYKQIQCWLRSAFVNKHIC